MRALPAERRAALLIDVGRAQAALGREESVLSNLLEAESAAPKWFVMPQPFVRACAGFTAEPGTPVRWESRLPGENSPHPRIDCYVVAPAIANFVAKLAAGVADAQVLTQVDEALGAYQNRCRESPVPTGPH